MKDTEAMKSRVYTSYQNTPATDFFLPVTQEHKLYLEGIDDYHPSFDNKKERVESHTASNQN